jgi:glycyl-tRNA synthetase
MTSKLLSFQDVIMRLQSYWAEHGCLIWQPYSEKVGAGTGNPATVLRVLGPEPWNVAYVEPSYRPDDGRYAENPNRMQMHTQYQVILKPAPANAQELYLGSLAAIGIDRDRHDIRFVEDNWESPALGAWGLGWEVWLDGLEITQYTYFQQAGGYPLDPVPVEYTYGLERIVMYLQGVKEVWQLNWDGGRTYGDLLRTPEIEHCVYDFEVADVTRLKQMYDLFEAEAKNALAHRLVIPAHDYVLRCSHTFNLLDSRGAIGVTERAAFFARMRDLARQVSVAYVEQRQHEEYPWLEETGRQVDKEQVDKGGGASHLVTLRQAQGKLLSPCHPSTSSGQALVTLSPFDKLRASSCHPVTVSPSYPATYLLEIGTEELPAGDVADAIGQLKVAAPKLLDGLRLAHGEVYVTGTPRRLVVMVKELAPRQADEETLVKGPPAERAFDASGAATPAAIGFARKYGVAVEALEIREEGRPERAKDQPSRSRTAGETGPSGARSAQRDGPTGDRPQQAGRYVYAVVRKAGRPTAEILAEALPGLIAGLKFGKAMRWNSTNVAFSRPIRWFVSLLGDVVIPFEYAGLTAGRTTCGPRAAGSPEFDVPSADAYLTLMAERSIMVDRDSRRAAIKAQVDTLAAAVGGIVPDDSALPTGGLRLLDEVTDLVEQPTALRGTFAEDYLRLPKDVLITVMKKHQRYFPVIGNKETSRQVDRAGKPLVYLSTCLLPYFITIRNGGAEHLDVVRAGNEGVIRARYADAAYFYRADTARKLEEFTPRLATLTFQEKLGSMLDKVRRLEKLAPAVGALLGLDEAELAMTARAAALCKSDLATQMVVELTSLQGIMGREYARLAGEPEAVANAIFEHYLPRSQGDTLPQSGAGLALGIANRLDSLVGLFAVGLAPTASADPFGLRRDALGLVQALVGVGQSFDLRPALEAAWSGVRGALSDRGLHPDGLAVQSEVQAFIRDRLYGWLRDQGLPHDVVTAVLAERGHNPYRAAVAARDLANLVQAPDWPELLVAYARCKRIVRGVAEVYPLAPELYAEEASKGLYAAWQIASGQMANRQVEAPSPAGGTGWPDEARDPRQGAGRDVEQLGQVLRDLRGPINRFFTDVLVMADDPAVRQARLALVQRIAALPDGIADLSQLQGF